MHAVLQDLNYGLRTLAKKRGFTIAAALSLALGIGLNTAIFTLVNTILLGSLPYRDADRLVMLSAGTSLSVERSLIGFRAQRGCQVCLSLVSRNLMPRILACAEVYATVGEISDRLHAVFGEYHER